MQVTCRGLPFPRILQTNTILKKAVKEKYYNKGIVLFVHNISQIF